MFHVSVKARRHALVILLENPQPLSIERLAEFADYSPRHTHRMITDLRLDGIVFRYRQRGEHAFSYSVNRESAIESGLL